MTPGELIALVVSALVTVITGVVVFMLKGYITDLKKYRNEREQKEQAKDELVLGMARVMLLENYRVCEAKGYYSMEDREVYGKLFIAYKSSGGNGIIDQLGPKLRELPTHTTEQG
jgi:hypothetical protein